MSSAPAEPGEQHAGDGLPTRPPGVSAVYAIADRYVTEWARLDPCGATSAGSGGHAHEMTDFSPAGLEARTDLVRHTLSGLAGVPAGGEADRRAASVMAERLRVLLDLDEAGEGWRNLRIIGSPLQRVRGCFDLMAYESADDWAAAAQRVAAVPEALEGVRATLQRGLELGLPAARRQALAGAEQAATWGGLRPPTRPFFATLLDRFDSSPAADRHTRAALATGVERATAAYADMHHFLSREYAAGAAERDPVGVDRYALYARSFTGSSLDLVDTYRWGWDELSRIETAMRACAGRILAGEPVAAVIEHLERDPARVVDGVDAFRRWNQELIDTTVAALDGTHFDIPEPIRRCEAMIAPPGGAAAMYYTGPSEDFARPGRTWYPTLGRERFPLWREVSTCFHEAVPGHHLQIAQVMYLADRLSRFQRSLGFVSGHGEGWALYAERLMGELGYLEDPAHELGMLAAQAMRSVRVIVDIGMHLELEIPAGSGYHDGERWTPELALPFVVSRSCFPEDFMRSEVDRYLGWPGQAISYKVGERAWLRARDAARARHGPRFDLKAFHAYALDLGGMGLDPLERELERF